MFWKKNKNTFGDRGYRMKDRYKADELIVANFQRVSSDFRDGSPMVETTKQKYIFEIVIDSEKNLKYREIFTGFIADDNEKFFDLPYIINPLPFTDYFSDTIGLEVPKLSLIWAQNDINYSNKDKSNDKTLKK